LHALCVSDLPDSGRVSVLGRDHIEVLSSFFGGQRRWRTVFSGPAEEMEQLYVAASAACPGNGAAADLRSHEECARDYQSIPGDCAAMMDMAAFASGSGSALSALMAGANITDEADVRLANELGLELTMAALYLRDSGMTLEEAGKLVVRVRDAVKAVEKRTFFHDGTTLGVISRASARENVPMVRHLDAYIEALGHGLSGWDTNDILATAESRNVSLADAAQVVAEQAAERRRRAAIPKTRRQRFVAWLAASLEHAAELVH